MERAVFDIHITAASPGRFRVEVDSPAGSVSEFRDFASVEHWLQVAEQLIPSERQAWRSGDMDRVSEEVRGQVERSGRWDPQATGEALYSEVFSGEIRRLFDESLGFAGAHEGSLSVRLHFELEDPQQARLATLPWELLYDPTRRLYLAHSENTPVVRYLRYEGPARKVRLPEVLRILVVTASPKDLQPLDTAIGNQLLEGWPQANIVVELLENPSSEQLRVALKNSFHILSFEGHGKTDAGTGEGAIALVGADGEAEWLPAKQLSAWLLNRPSLRLVVLNACSTGAEVGDRAFSGMASSLVRSGVPAVLAMQRAIPDDQAVYFARELYSRLMDGRPLEAALSSARHELWVKQPNANHWSTPTLLEHTNGIFHVSADSRPALTRIFSWLSVVTANIAYNAWSRTRGGPEIPGFTFSNMAQETVPFFGVLIVVPMMIVLLWMILRYQSISKDTGLYHRFPIAFSMPIGPSRALANFFQLGVLIILVVLPACSQFHFMHKIYRGAVWRNEAPYANFSKGYQHLIKPIGPSVWFTDDYRFGPKKSESGRHSTCAGLKVCSVTFFPFWQPWIFVMLNGWMFILLNSVIWGIWSRRPPPWRRLSVKKFLSISAFAMIVAAILGASRSEGQTLEQVGAAHRTHFEEIQQDLLRPADLRLVIGTDPIDDILSSLLNLEVPLEGLQGAILSLDSATAQFSDGFPGLEAHIGLRVGDSDPTEVKFRVDGYVEIQESADYFTLRLRLIRATQLVVGDEQPEKMLGLMVQAALAGIEKGLAEQRVPRAHDLPVNYGGGIESIHAKTGPGTMDLELVLPSITATVPARISRLFALRDGLHVDIDLMVGTDSTGPGTHAGGLDRIRRSAKRVSLRLAGTFFEKIFARVQNLPPDQRRFTLRSIRRDGPFVKEGGDCGYFVELDKHSSLAADLNISQIRSDWIGEGGLRANLLAKGKVDARLHWHVKCLIGGGFGDRVNLSPAIREDLSLALTFLSSRPPRFQFSLVRPRSLKLKQKIDLGRLGSKKIVIPLPLPRDILAEGPIPSVDHWGTFKVNGQSRPYELSLEPVSVSTDPLGVEVDFSFDSRFPMMAEDLEGMR